MAILLYLFSSYCALRNELILECRLGQKNYQQQYKGRQQTEKKNGNQMMIHHVIFYIVQINKTTCILQSNIINILYMCIN